MRGSIGAFAKGVRRQNEKQPQDDVNDGDTTEQRREAAHDVVKDGQELEVFVVQNLLWIC